MDSKKVIEKLVKIAQSQQKIINKLAQDMVAAKDPQQQKGVLQMDINRSIPQGAGNFTVTNVPVMAAGGVQVSVDHPDAKLKTPESMKAIQGVAGAVYGVKPEAVKVVWTASVAPVTV
jgi:hypothetical protein